MEISKEYQHRMDHIVERLNGLSLPFLQKLESQLKNYVVLQRVQGRCCVATALAQNMVTRASEGLTDLIVEKKVVDKIYAEAYDDVGEEESVHQYFRITPSVEARIRRCAVYLDCLPTRKVLEAFDILPQYYGERQADDLVGNIVHYLDEKARKGEDLVLEEQLIAQLYEAYTGK